MKKIILISLLLVSSFSYAETIDKVLAIVNGEILTQSDLKNFKQRIKKESLLDDLFDVDYQKLLANQKKIVDHLIDQKIVDSEVRRLKLDVSQSRIEAEVKKIAAGLNVGVSGLKNRLKQDNIAFEDYKDFLKRRLERQALIQREITSKIRISDDEVKSFYAKNSQNKATDLFQYNLSHILIKADENKDSALGRAKMVRDKINDGMDFSNAASKYTEDPNFSSGGYLGTFKSGEFLPAFEEAVKNIEEGDISKPVLVGSNYIILKLNKKQIVENPDFLKVREQIRSRLQQLAFKKQFLFWLGQKRSEADIKRN